MLPNGQMGMSSYGHSHSDSFGILKPFHCPSCPAQFFEKFELKAHMSGNHGDQMPFCCEICGKGYLSARGLHHHLSLHKGQLYICPLCDRKMNYKSVCKRHLRGVHKSDQCARCMQVFPLEEFDLHIKSCQA